MEGLRFPPHICDRQKNLRSSWPLGDSGLRQNFGFCGSEVGCRVFVALDEVGCS